MRWDRNKSNQNIMIINNKTIVGLFDGSLTQITSSKLKDRIVFYLQNYVHS